jgi:hypothetical protein
VPGADVGFLKKRAVAAAAAAGTARNLPESASLRFSVA